MWKRIVSFVVFSLLVLPPFSLSARVFPPDSSSCLLIQREALLEECRLRPQERASSRRLEAFDADIDRIHQSEALSAADRTYYDGVVAWRKGDKSAARNSWFKFLELVGRYKGGVGNGRIAEVEKYFQQINKEVGPEHRVVMGGTIEGPEDEKGGTRPFISAKAPRRKKTRSSQPSSPRVDVAQIIRRAKKARKDGQFEFSRRLFESAKQMELGTADSRSTEIDEQLAELKKEMSE